MKPLNREFRIASLDPRYRIGSLVSRGYDRSRRRSSDSLPRGIAPLVSTVRWKRGLSRKIRACTVNRAREPRTTRLQRPVTRVRVQTRGRWKTYDRWTNSALCSTAFHSFSLVPNVPRAASTLDSRIVAPFIKLKQSSTAAATAISRVRVPELVVCLVRSRASLTPGELSFALDDFAQSRSFLVGNVEDCWNPRGETISFSMSVSRLFFASASRRALSVK